MKNIHTLPTDKPSRVHFDNKLFLSTNHQISRKINSIVEGRNIYITSDEEIRDLRPYKGKWHLEKQQILNKFPDYLTDLSECKLVIMTTDQDLIKDDVQPIDDEFLEWFVKNPSCEEVRVERLEDGQYVDRFADGSVVEGIYENYKIIIPKDEAKQENDYTSLLKPIGTKQSAVEWYSDKLLEILGDNVNLFTKEQTLANHYALKQAKEMEEQQRGYSEEDMINALHSVELKDNKDYSKIYNGMKVLLEELKNK